MGAVTYPDELVKDLVVSRYVTCQLNTQEEPAKEVVEKYRQAWTPDIRLLDQDGFDLYHWNGYLPPAEFVPQLLTAEGEARLRLGQLELAIACLEEVVRRFPTAMAAAEAQYFWFSSGSRGSSRDRQGAFSG